MLGPGGSVEGVLVAGEVRKGKREGEGGFAGKRSEEGFGYHGMLLLFLRG